MSRIRHRIDKLHEQHTQRREGYELPAGTRISDADYEPEAFAVTVGMGKDRESMIGSIGDLKSPDHAMSGDEYRRRYPRGLLIELRILYREETPLSDRVQPMKGYERMPKLPESTDGGRGGHV